MGRRVRARAGAVPAVPNCFLILASASPRRRSLLARLGAPFAVRPCELSEPAVKPTRVTAPAWAEALAYFKARAVAERFPGHWTLGADTIVVCAGEMLGKARDRADADRMLRMQAGRASEVVTGVALVHTGGCPRRIVRHETTRVWMRDAPAEIAHYLDSGDWMGKAGAYGIQDTADVLIERIEGSFSNVVGLPLERVYRILTAAGIAVRRSEDSIGHAGRSIE